MKTSIYNIHIRELASELNTRPSGVSARDKLLGLLERYNEIEIDVGFVNLTPSFADECVGRLAAVIGLSEFKKRIRLLHVGDSDRPLIRHLVLRRCSENVTM